MEEIETPILFLPFQHFFSQNIVLLKKNRKVLFLNRVRLVGRCHDRLDRDLVKAEVRQMENVGREIKIEVRIGAAHVVT